jgi:hypothetical protein
MDSKDIDFKTYYHKKLDEEMEAAQQSTAEQSYETQSMNASLDSLIQRYVGNGDLKEGLKKLGVDLGDAIFKFAIERYVTSEQFASQDDQAKYVNIITQKIQQNAAKTLVELLKHCAIDISNTKNSITM